MKCVAETKRATITEIVLVEKVRLQISVANAMLGMKESNAYWHLCYARMIILVLVSLKFFFFFRFINFYFRFIPFVFSHLEIIKLDLEGSIAKKDSI